MDAITLLIAVEYLSVIRAFCSGVRVTSVFRVASIFASAAASASASLIPAWANSSRSPSSTATATSRATSSSCFVFNSLNLVAIFASAVAVSNCKVSEFGLFLKLSFKALMALSYAGCVVALAAISFAS